MNVFARKPATPAAPRNNIEYVSVSDPRFPRWLGMDSAAGVPVNEYTAMTVSAVWRAALLVSSSLAGLPLRTMREWGATRAQIASWLDNPATAVGYKPFNWKQTSILHMLLGGDSFQRHLYNAVGALAGVEPINPRHVAVYWDPERPGGKRFEVTLIRQGKAYIETHDASTMTQVMGPTLDGLRGLSVVGMARTSLGGAIAADQAAAHTFRNGPMIGGLAVPQEDLDDGDAEKAQAILNDEIGGTENAGRIVVLERKFDLKPWTMTLKDAQFLESRQFSIQEVARWFGVHPVFLMDPGAVSTWGTGVEILQRGLGRFTLPQWTDPFQEAMSDLLPRNSWAEFDFHGLERGSPQEEVQLLIAQIDGGLLTINQALALINRPGVGPDGDVLRIKGIPISSQPGKATPIAPPNPDEEPDEQVSPTSAVPAIGARAYGLPTSDELRAMLTGDAR
jgi:HK97 family phage portal protein